MPTVVRVALILPLQAGVWRFGLYWPVGTGAAARLAPLRPSMVTCVGRWGRITGGLISIRYLGFNEFRRQGHHATSTREALTMTKATYSKPFLRRFGLLRRLTLFSF